MRKIIYVMLASIMIVVAACSGNATKSPETTTDSTKVDSVQVDSVKVDSVIKK